MKIMNEIEAEIGGKALFARTGPAELALARAGEDGAQPRPVDAGRPADWWDGKAYDYILVDAPCSGIGVLRRHPDAKGKKDVGMFARHQTLQAEILKQASSVLRPGGVLVYSTCSIEPEETESIIDEYCQAHHQFRRESIAPWLPPAGLPFVTPRGDLSTMANMNRMDAFFAARVRRSE